MWTGSHTLQPLHQCSPTITLAVTGTPGIGKSVFFYYCVARLVQSDNPPEVIVWEHRADPGVVVRLLLGAFRTFCLGLAISHALETNWVLQERRLHTGSHVT